jgi:hypothetical protein
VETPDAKLAERGQTLEVACCLDKGTWRGEGAGDGFLAVNGWPESTSSEAWPCLKIGLVCSNRQGAPRCLGAGTVHGP